ncbi:hypothetical protein [Pseudomonas sp. Irchel s3f19]|uniref:TRAFAC clade GTPase domain-containing protein n=1 Tax=Pseudomonas sp. Irchel s3f19 TaxID=2009146 RepID=UPI002115593C|nr:hypothetical protein [Pseudomonas sp. Irchel s3f19]
MRRCTNPNCNVHDGETCVLGELVPESCTEWNSTLKESNSTTEAVSHPIETRVPWSGSALGLSDLLLLLPRSKHILVGVLGAHNGGKTTLLAANYLLMLQGRAMADAMFSGSRTLHAWESLASWMRFDDSARPPTFPPHTPRASNRVPGLLHIALRREGGDFRDVLLADAPGEWFSSWAVSESAPQAEGARWLSMHSDAFIVVADCQRLSGQERGLARKELLQLLDRLANHIADRPLTLLWTKSEYDVPVGIKKAISEALKNSFPRATEHAVSIKTPESFATPIDATVRAAWRLAAAGEILIETQTDDPFLSFRGHHAHA